MTAVQFSGENSDCSVGERHGEDSDVVLLAPALSGIGNVGGGLQAECGHALEAQKLSTSQIVCVKRPKDWS